MFVVAVTVVVGLVWPRLVFVVENCPLVHVVPAVGVENCAAVDTF